MREQTRHCGKQIRAGRNSVKLEYPSDAAHLQNPSGFLAGFSHVKGGNYIRIHG